MYSRDILSEVEKYQGWKAIFEKVFISFHICISIYIIVGNLIILTGYMKG